MRARNKLLTRDQRRIFLSGLGSMLMAYLLASVITAAFKGESVYRHIFYPAPEEIATRLSFMGVLLLFIAYASKLLHKYGRMADALVKYQAGMDASVDGIAILNNTYECLYLNNSLTKIYGYDSYTELLGKPWGLFYGDDEIRRFKEEILPLIFAKGEWRGEAVGRRRDGRVFPQEISLTSINGNGIVCIVRDITDHKNFEEELERKASELSATNRELEAFSYSLTHDMRNYITRSYSAAQILQESYLDSLDENGQYLVKIVCDANLDMEVLVKGMLALSRMIRSEIRREKTDLSQMARDIGAELMLDEPGRLLEFVVTPDLVVECDPHLMKVALANLLNNAWKYTRKAAEAKVEFGMVEYKGGQAFFVRDNGIGFDMCDADKLFKPFQRLQNASEFPGNGIGLTTVQRVILRHGGKMWGEGEPGKGATFYFTLPA